MARFDTKKNINFRNTYRVKNLNKIRLGLMSGPFIGAGLHALFGY